MSLSHRRSTTVSLVFRLMADEESGEYGKKDWVEEVGEKKMAAVLIEHVEQVGLCLFPGKSN